MSVFVTGDIHGYPIRFDQPNLDAMGLNLTQNDKVIICGDFGLPWYGDEEDKLCLDWLRAKPFEILFIDGNHENFDLLYQFPVEERYGGKVHKLRENIFHLMRGEVYEIEGKKYFAFGGSTSADKYTREEGVLWWKEEIHNQEEYDNALKNLDKVNFNVDYVITHTAPKHFLENVSFNKQGAEDCPVVIMLDELEKRLSYSKWFVGHFHVDYEDEKNNVIWSYKEIHHIYVYVRRD
jgi:hypothetical protein